MLARRLALAMAVLFGLMGRKAPSSLNNIGSASGGRWTSFSGALQSSTPRRGANN